MRSGRVLLGAFLLVSAACRRDQWPLEDVQKMAYAVKPAVVRVSAFATAEMEYSPAAVTEVAERLRMSGRNIAQRDPGPSAPMVDAGAGGSGSGFIIHPDGFILTSGHVVSPTRDRRLLEQTLRRNGAIAVLVRHFALGDLRSLSRGDELEPLLRPIMATARLRGLKIVNQVELSNGETLPFTTRRFSPQLGEGGSDLAVISVARRDLPTLPLGDSDSTRVGESVWSVGYPAVASSTDEVIGGWLSRDSDLEATFNPGTITAIKTNSARAPIFQSNVAIYRGNSGGPAVNRAGEVIGISTWGHTSAEQIKFLVPINIARPLLREAGVPAGEAGGAFNEHYRAALQAANDGRWEEVRASLALAGRTFPNSPDVIRLGHDAGRALAKLPLWRRYPLSSLTAISVLGLLVLLATVSLVRRRPPSAVAAERLEAAAWGARPTVETVVAPADGGAGHGKLGRFTVLNGARAGEKLGLGGSGIRIGRESAMCEIVLENPKISRLHAEVVALDGKVLLVDRNSSNGTYVNDQKIEKRYLQDGDIIYFGGRNAIAVAFHA